MTFGPRFQVADADFPDNDFPEKMNWDDAVAACRTLGGGWRLPTKEELTGMYEFLHLKGKGNFSNTRYWSSSEDDAEYAWCFYFDGGLAHSNYKTYTRQVRAVRAF